jgi:tetratricopeptide (TPR) repeat protein
MSDRQDHSGRDYFVSYTSADRRWAQWIGWQLNQDGYEVILQAWDMVPGTDFVHEMQVAATTARRTVAVLSPSYFSSKFGEAEWRVAFANDPTGERGLLIPVRVAAFDPPGLLATRVYIDLVGKGRDAARVALLEGVRGREAALPMEEPEFPGDQSPAAVEEVGSDELEPQFPTTLPPVWNVPFRRNPAFTGRQEMLERLAAQRHGGMGAVTQAVHGGGGVGKTATAVEYTYRFRAAFDTVWWVRAGEPTTLVGDYAELAAARGLPEAAVADQQQVALAVRRWLSGHDRWLLVLDNAEGPTTTTGLTAPLARLVDLLPAEPRGQVLVTSRDATWRQAASIAELALFTSDEAVGFLLARVGSRERQAAGQIAELLGYLPLALEQAAAYVEETGITLGAYLDRLRQFPDVMLAQGEPRDRDPTDTVSTTWQVSVERVRPVPGALVLLEIAAFLAPDDVPRDLFAHPLDPPAAELADLGVPVTLDRAVGALRRYGLVKTAEGGLTVHRLLQQVVRDGLDPETAGSRIGLAVRLLAEAFPWEGFTDPATWPTGARLLSHALVAADHAERQDVEPAVTARLLAAAANYLGGRARYRDARPLHERAVVLAEMTFGPQDPSTGLHLNELGYLLLRAGDTAAARPVLERALAISEATLGPDHSEVGISLDNLGQVLHAQGDLEGARQYLGRALAVKQATLGPDHYEVGITLNNLALVLHREGDLKGARQHLERALAIYEATLGPDHPEVGITLNNLALVLQQEGDLDGARQHLER